MGTWIAPLAMKREEEGGSVRSLFMPCSHRDSVLLVLVREIHKRPALTSRPEPHLSCSELRTSTDLRWGGNTQKKKKKKKTRLLNYLLFALASYCLLSWMLDNGISHKILLGIIWWRTWTWNHYSKRDSFSLHIYITNTLGSNRFAAWVVGIHTES